MQANVGGRWATPGQWDQHRNTITSLYRRHTLSDIIRIMQKEHGFYATPRMYKLRIHAWGLRKNLNFKEAKELLERMIDRQQLPPDRDWHATLSQVHSYIARLPPIKQATLMKLYELVDAAAGPPPESQNPCIHAAATTQPRPPSPPTHIRELSLAAGCDLRRAEACVHHLRLFILGAFDNAWWSHDTVPAIAETRRLFLWYQSSVVFQGALRRRKTAQAFQVIRPYFDQQSLVLASRDPRLFGSTVAFVALVAAAAPEVGASALRFAAAVAGATHGRSHPYTVLLQALLDLATTATKVKGGGGGGGGDQSGFTTTAFLPTVMDWYYRFLGEQARPDRPLGDIIQQCRHAAQVLGQRSEVRRQQLDHRSDGSGGKETITSSSGSSSNRQISMNLDEVRRYMCHYSATGRPIEPKKEDEEEEEEEATAAAAAKAKAMNPGVTTNIALATSVNSKSNNNNNNNNNNSNVTKYSKSQDDLNTSEAHDGAMPSNGDLHDALSKLVELTDLEQALAQDADAGADGLQGDAVRQELDVLLDRYCERFAITDG
ncbi:hypothetical protein PG996_002926 [Apiospora saccharicola]|uniref:Clr5 domain-containing protein n=1 Tax=Apiospora saccharicola TaxID=335842 RepID=A0ABR1WKR2_9PEZI